MVKPLQKHALPPIPDVADALRELADLAHLEADWDSYDAEPITDDTIALAHALIVTMAAQHHVRPYDLFPLNSGAVQITWRANDILFDVQVSAHFPFQYLLVEGSGADRRAVEEHDATLDQVLQVATKIANH